MRKYETVFILNPALDEEGYKANVEKFKGVIENAGGTVDNVDLWGKRKL
ncbi:30S ribosomal protein S6, partial [Clostridium sporogenes]